jgi:hypothetical protein
MAVFPKSEDIVDKKKDVVHLKTHTLPFCIDLNIGPEISPTLCCNLKHADCNTF